MKPTPQDPFSENSEDTDYTLQIVLLLCGLAGVLWLVIEPNHPIGRIIAGMVAVSAIAALTWRHCLNIRQAHQKKARLIEQMDELSEASKQAINALQTEYDTLDYYFHTLMEHIPANIYFKDKDSRFLKVNQRMAESFGCSHPEDLLNKTDHDFFDADHADQALADEQRVIKTGKPIEEKIEHEIFSNGRSGWVLTAKTPFRDRDGKLIGTFGMSSNITELVETRNTLERERNMLRSLIDSFPDPIFVRDLDRHYLVVNNAMAKWLGLKNPTKMLGKKPEDFFPDELVKVGAKEDKNLLATGEPVINRLWKSRNYKNDIRYVSTTKVPWIDEKGRTLGIVGMDRDITESRRARTQLEQTEKQLQDLMDNSPAVIYLKDIEGHYIMVNQGFEELFGLDRDDVLGRTDHEFIKVKETADRFQQGDQKVIETENAIQMDERLYVNGEPRWYVSVRFPLFDRRGKIDSIAGILTDITDRKESEVAMHRLNEELVKANEDLQHAHEQLIQAEKMESIGRLASGVAHEVKNPLAMIGMGLELLARRIPEDDQAGREALQRMERGIERAKTIVKGLVDFSSNRQIERLDVDPNELVRDALTLVDYQLRKAKIKVVESLGENLPPIKADVTKLEQVIVNLIINAMHAMEGGGTLSLSTSTKTLTQIDRDAGSRSSENLREGDCVVCIQVRDTGKGIDPEHLAKLYDPFFTTKPTGLGTGLGLSVSRKIIELHHGILQIENNPSGGACATITLGVPQS